WNRVASFHRAETQGARLLFSKHVFSARLQPSKDAAIVIDEIMELLAALDEMGIPVHEEFIWVYFVPNLPPGYKFIKNNLQGSKEPLTRTVSEDALGSRYNVQSGGKKGRTIPDSALFVSSSKAGRGVGRGGSRGGTNKGNLDSRGRSEGLPSQAKITCNHCQKPGHIRPNCPERQCFKCRGWGHEAVSCPSKVLTPKENGDKKNKDEWVADSGCSQFMTPSADYMVNYREGGGVVRTADGRAMPIESIGNLPMSF
ncbi:unnamed protein product, partial [Ascophyllum nodosum]